MRKIAEVKLHKGYNKRTIANDVAVVKLSAPFTFNGKFSVENKYKSLNHNLFLKIM